MECAGADECHVHFFTTNSVNEIACDDIRIVNSRSEASLPQNPLEKAVSFLLDQFQEDLVKGTLNSQPETFQSNLDHLLLLLEVSTCRNVCLKILLDKIIGHFLGENLNWGNLSEFLSRRALFQTDSDEIRLLNLHPNVHSFLSIQHKE